MARIAGVDIPDKKRGEISLTYIYGIGRSSARKILEKAGINYDKKVAEWSDEESNAVRGIINGEFNTEGALRSEAIVKYYLYVVRERRTIAVLAKESVRQ
jgi:small subunit ribosomal protein S13